MQIIINPAYHNPRGVRKVYRMLERELRFKNIRFSDKTRGARKIEKKNCIDISVFSYENKKKYGIYASRNTFKNMLISYF